MLKNLKKAAAIVLSFAMAVQFGLADSYYVNAVEEPVEPQQEETKTTTAKPAEKKAETATVKAEKKETAAAKAIETKKDTTKKLETKAAVLVDTPEVQAEEVKETVKKAAKKVAAKAEDTAEKAVKTVKKAAAKKTAAKTTKKAELKTEFFLQFSGKEYTEKEILKKVKDVWTKDLKNKVGDMKDVKIYLKPEESAAYYVVNGDTTGKIDL